MRKIILIALFPLTFISLKAQVTLVDTFAFEYLTAYNSFWSITDVDGVLHLGSDLDGDIFTFEEGSGLGNMIDVDDAITFSHGLVWDGSSFWVAEDYTSNGASLFQLDASGNILSSFVLPEQIGGNSSGIGGLTMDGGEIWFSVYYPDFDEFPFGYAYKINPITQAITDTLPLHGKQVYGISSYGDYIFYVTDDINGDEERIYTYSKLEQDTLFSFPLLDPDGDSSPRGLHWFDDHLWLLAKRPGSSAFAYSMLYKYQIELGETLLPEMSLTESSIDFGPTIVGEMANLAFFIKNTGMADLTIDDVGNTNSVFLINHEDLPFTIEPGDSSVVTISFLPDDMLVYTDFVTVSSDDQDNPIQNVNITGEGIVVNGINSNELDIAVKVFPNPIREMLSVEFSSSKVMPIEINLHQINGKQIRHLAQTTSSNQVKNLSFDTSNLKAGQYLLEFKNESGVSQTIQILKQ